MTLQIVAFAGPKGSGKDTAADMLADLLRARGVPVQRFALATPIREAADAMGVPREWTREGKDTPRPEWGGRTGRDLLNAIGKATRGTCGEDFFACEFLRRAREWASVRSRAVAVVSDLRRQAEAWTLCNGAPGALVWLDRPGHESDSVLEAEVRGCCDMTLWNDSSLAWLRSQVSNVYDRVMR